MAKAASPIRIQDDLMSAAIVAGKTQHRSTAEQIEYWASIGRSVADQLTPAAAVSLMSGISQLSVKPVHVAAIDPEAVFSSIEQKRQSGTLADRVAEKGVRYQASLTRPGQLEQVCANGQIVIGQFSNGVFLPAEKTD